MHRHTQTHMFTETHADTQRHMYTRVHTRTQQPCSGRPVGAARPQGLVSPPSGHPRCNRHPLSLLGLPSIHSCSGPHPVLGSPLSFKRGGYLSVCLSRSHALPGGLCPTSSGCPFIRRWRPAPPGWTPSFYGPTSSFFLVHPLGFPERGRNGHLSLSSPPETLRVELNPGSCLENSPTRSYLRTQDTGDGVHWDRQQAIHGRQAQQRGHKRPGHQLHREGNRLAATAPAPARPRQLRRRRRSAPGPTDQHVELDGWRPHEARCDRGGRNLVVFWLAILFLNLGCTSTAEAKSLVFCPRPEARTRASTAVPSCDHTAPLKRLRSTLSDSSTSSSSSRSSSARGPLPPARAHKSRPLSLSVRRRAHLHGAG